MKKIAITLVMLGVIALVAVFVFAYAAALTAGPDDTLVGLMAITLLLAFILLFAGTFPGWYD